MYDVSSVSALGLLQRIWETGTTLGTRCCSDCHAGALWSATLASHGPTAAMRPTASCAAREGRIGPVPASAGGKQAGDPASSWPLKDDAVSVGVSAGVSACVSECAYVCVCVPAICAQLGERAGRLEAGLQRPSVPLPSPPHHRRLSSS